MSAPTIDANLTLAKAMGSKRGYDPMPPDQHEWQRAEGDPPLYRLWSWMCGHTIRKGFRSPFAVDEKGKPLALKHAARDLELDLGQVSNLWSWGEKKGLWHRQDGRELRLNGSVTAAQVTEANKQRQVECTNSLGRAELLKIKEWPKTRRDEFYAFWTPAQEYRARLSAAAIAQARETCDELDDTILRRFGIEKKRLAKRRPPEPVEVPQMLLEFVHSTEESVHPASAHSTPVERTDGEETGENASVHSAHIRNQRTTSENSASSSSVDATDSESIAQAFQIDDDAAKQILEACREVEPTITAPQVIALGLDKLKGTRVRNRPGFLLVALPKLCKGPPLDWARQVAPGRHERSRTARGDT